MHRSAEEEAAGYARLAPVNPESYTHEYGGRREGGQECMRAVLIEDTARN